MKIFNSKILNYLLCGFLVVLAFYLLHRNVTYHSLLEGMRNDKPFDEVVEEVGSKNKVMEDQLLIDKHRTHHENLITHLEESANMHMLELYKEQAGNVRNGASIKEQMKTIRKINNFGKLKEHLNNSMEYLDGK
jgi:hypothetical protein